MTPLCPTQSQLGRVGRVRRQTNEDVLAEF